MTRNRLCSSLALIIAALLPFASAAAAQIAPTVRVARNAPVFDAARGDSVRIGMVQAGTIVEVLDRQRDWLLVSAPAGTSGWTRGWLHVSTLELASADLIRAQPKKPAGRLMLRGFAHAGGSLFTADDSFDAITGSPFAMAFGGGGQVVFPNGLFVQVFADRVRETGSRALVSGTQIFTIPTENTVTVLPVEATVGYRGGTIGATTAYLGAGAGWYRFTEESPSLPGEPKIRDAFVGYHVLGGVEFPFSRWLSLAGEVQWAAVPNALGESGLSAVFGEDDLGGTTFRVKVIVGY
jgi:hypothetical protein